MLTEIAENTHYDGLVIRSTTAGGDIVTDKVRLDGKAATVIVSGRGIGQRMVLTGGMVTDNMPCQ